MYTVRLSKLIEKMNLENVTPDIEIRHIKISQPDVNRPALQLAGFFDHFDSDRVQVIGHVEYAYMQKMENDHGIGILSKLMDYRVPCIVFCRNIEVNPAIIKLATDKGIPILRTTKTTSSFMAEVIRWLNVELAPRISIHGVLVDVYGEGILIMGESGIGKSEAALELIKRGHRLVTDDVVEIKKVSDDTLIGTAPDITRHFIELRGIGIIDVKTLFGVESVKNTQSIDLVIKLEEWNKDQEYDRLGLEEQYTEFLGNKVVCHSIPIRPGRNLAIICESAAVNYRQKKMGYNAAQELYNRVTNNLMKKSKPEED
jgi:HPr kinase/phosphorylase